MAETVPTLLRAAARRWNDKAALRPMRAPPTSFAELDEGADAFARALIADGMQAGERLAVWAPNRWEWVVATVGAQRAGGAVVPLNPRLRGLEAGDILRRARATRLVCVAEHNGVDFPAMLAGEQLPLLRRVILLGPGGTQPGGRQVWWDQFLEGAAETTPAALLEREAGVTPDSVADIMFTSGTTGAPKGAVFTHRKTVLSGLGTKYFAGVTEADTLCPLGPFAHFAGYKAGWVNGLTTGATVTWTDAHDAVSILDAIATLGITVMPAPPIVWDTVLNHPNRRDWDTSSLRFAATGSTMVPPELVRRLVSEMQVRQVGTGFGLTESGGMTNFTRPDDAVERVAQTAGTPAPDAEVCIVDPAGLRLGPGEPGEILVRTPRAMVEYLDNPAATRAALDPDGWLHTGDVGTVDEAGYLKVTDRLTDMFITNGYNVYPAELERLIGSLEGVAQCAVVERPEPRKGEVGHAFLVRSQGATLTEAEVLAWCRDNMAGYKVPKGVTFMSDLPRNALGKVLKRELRALI